MAPICGYRRGFDFGAALLVLGLAACATMPPPTEQIAVSRAAVDDAVSAGSTEYAAALLASAQDKLARADAAMAAHDYPAAARWSEEAEVDARYAAVTARSAKAQRSVIEIRESIRALQDELARTRS